MRAVFVVVALWTASAAAACGDNLRGQISIVADPAFEAAIGELARGVPYPIGVGTHGNGFRIDVVKDPAIPAEGYRLEAGRPDRDCSSRPRQRRPAELPVLTRRGVCGFRWPAGQKSCCAPGRCARLACSSSVT